MRICAKCRHHRRWANIFWIVNRTCFARVTYRVDPITGYRNVDGEVDCSKRNADGNCPDFERAGLIGWLKRLLGLNATPAGETMQAAQQRTEIQWLDKSEARDGR